MATTYAEQKRRLRPHACPGGTTYQPPDRPVVGGKDREEIRLAAVEKEEGTYRYKHYRKTNGYANMPLDGVWLRAPYLHNGSVPTLRDLLEPQPQAATHVLSRQRYLRPKKCGFLSTEPKDAERQEALLLRHQDSGQRQQRSRRPRDTAPNCRRKQKEALLEYLKTF